MDKEQKTWQTLEDDVQREKLRKNPFLFLGSLGASGLEALLMHTLDALIQVTPFPKEASLSVVFSDRQMLFTLTSDKELLMNKMMTLSYPFLFLLYAFSEQLGISLEENDQRFIQIYEGSVLKQDVQMFVQAEQHRLEIAFTPDATLFGEKLPDYFMLLHRCQQLAMLHSGLRITLAQDAMQRNELHYEQGLIAYLFQRDDPTFRSSQPLVIQTEKEGVQIEAVLSKNGMAHIADSFVNDHFLIEGGTHLEGFLQGSVAALNQFLEETNRFQYLTPENLSERFDFVLSIHMENPKYHRGVRKKIRNPELAHLVNTAIFDEMILFLRRHPTWYTNE